jgi:hypothetical protein
MKPTIITFLTPWRGYSVGETAGFDDDVAQKLIDGGAAEAYSGKKKSTRAASQSTDAPNAAGVDSTTGTAPPGNNGSSDDTGTGSNDGKP